MDKENFNKIYDDVSSGKLTKKEALGIIAKFISENYPLFKLHRYDEDFRSELMLAFFEKGERLFECYNPQKSDFFKYFYYFVTGLMSLETRCLANKNYKETLIFEENISSYAANENDYSIQNTFETKMFVKSEKTEYKPLTKVQLQKFYHKVSLKFPDKKILVLALKSSFYLKEYQVKKVCELYEIKEHIFYDTIQYCKMSVAPKYLKYQKAVERRNYNYYHHRKCSKKLKEFSEYKNKADSVVTKNRLLCLNYRHYNHWQNLNDKFEKGFLYLRPTNKTIGEILGICERQVSYYINCAKKDAKNNDFCVV